MSTQTLNTLTLDQLLDVQHIIEETHALFEEDINWIRGAEAVDTNFNQVPSYSTDAVAWSLVGGLHYEDSDYITFMRGNPEAEPQGPFASDLAEEFLEQVAGWNLTEFNDRQGYSAVKRLLLSASIEIGGRIIEAEEE